jgi:hypothetical protein
MIGFYGLGGKADRAFARWPTHAMRLHEWGTRGMGWILCMGHPPPGGSKLGHPPYCFLGFSFAGATMEFGW